MIEITIPNFGDISVTENGKLILFVKRKTSIKGNVECIYYIDDKPFLKTLSHQVAAWKIDIDNISPNYEVKKIKSSLTKSIYWVNGNTVTIKHNLFFFLNKMVAKIYCNDLFVGEVKIKNIIGANKKLGFSQFVNFNITDESLKTSSLIAYVITCNLVNS